MNVGLTFTIGAKDLASKVLKGVGNAIRDTFVVAGGQLLAQGLVKAMNGLRSFVDMAFEAEAANTALDASMRGLGIYTPQLSQKFKELASAIQNETGVSDEMVKNNIAQLLTLGVMPEKIGMAARAVQALTAVGKDNQSAMLAVGKMLEGDLSGFERLSPAVKNATTIHEKFAEVQKLLTSGYEQQKAKLETVGGAWEALKGRMGDAIEDMGLAIFEGAGLGKTFGDMQAKVGAFLQSEQWSGFLDSIKEGAKFAKQLASDLMNQGGFMESMKSISLLISSAFVDGAKMAVDAIKKELVESRIGRAITLANKAQDYINPMSKISELIMPSIERAMDYLVPKDEGKNRTQTALDSIRNRSASNPQKEINKTFALNPWMKGDEGLKRAYLRDEAKWKQREEDSKKQEFADAENLALQKEEVETRKRLNGAIEKQVDQIEQNFANYGKQQDDEDRRKKAQERYAMLRSEFIDPTKRTDRMKAESLAEQTFTQLQLEEAQIRQKFSQMGAGFKPSEREQQVIDLIKAKEEAGGIGNDYSKETAENTRDLAIKIDSLLKMRTV